MKKLAVADTPFDADYRNVLVGAMNTHARINGKWHLQRELAVRTLRRRDRQNLRLLHGCNATDFTIQWADAEKLSA